MFGTESKHFNHGWKQEFNLGGWEKEGCPNFGVQLNINLKLDGSGLVCEKC
jgi:hypothetical protein